MLGFGGLLMVVLVSATTVITDKGITFDQGDIISLANITLGDEPLFFRDGPDNNIRAIFNGNSSLALITTQATINLDISKATTSFIGDVDNFDDINAFSRFKETNINDGTNASAGFIGVNDIGNSLSFGIGSSNFEFMNQSANNIGVIRLRSPSDMFFVNDFIKGWFWVSDQNDTTGITDPRFVMDLDAKGNLGIIGNFIGDGNIDLAGDLTLGDIITFGNGETIDGLTNNQIRITGGLRVEGDLITIGNENVSGDLQVTGAINNFNNLNEFTKITQLNTNNGTTASAGYIATNDVGNSIILSIASSGFEFFNQSVPNFGLLRLASPGDMLFLNDFSTNWAWITNISNPIIAMALSPTGNLSIIGNFSADGDANILRDIFGGNNLDITGNFTGNQFYFEGSFFQPVNRQTVTPSGLFDPEPITFNVNKTNGFTVIGNDEFEALVPGKYRIFYSVSYLDGAAQSHVFGVGLSYYLQRCLLEY